MCLGHARQVSRWRATNRYVALLHNERPGTEGTDTSGDMGDPC